VNKYRTKVLTTMQLCSLVLSTLFVAALGSLEGSMATLWLEAICSRAAARPRASAHRPSKDLEPAWSCRGV